MTWPRKTRFSFRHPAVVPAGALIAALVLAVVVGRFGGSESTTGTPPQTPAPTAAPTAAPVTTPPEPTPSSTPTAAPAFVAAPDGKPRFTVDADAQDPLPGYRWMVLIPDPAAPAKLKPRGNPADGQPNVVVPLGEALVNRLLCVTVPEGWTVSVPAAVPNLTPQGENAALTACQGGWSDLRAVPRDLTFTAAKAS